ncbi:hypothetical protein Ciccas_009849 [Cichlidogyrus casuarinus]|uniref:C-type lectin domain-containing protein n=1 Tax=Cichlidogyrus casuarinus TaxID=1844966 RepID=A0ABD2PVX3_9PLAT
MSVLLLSLFFGFHIVSAADGGESLQGIELTRGRIGLKLFTYVHGSDKAKMNFTEAQEFCSNNLVISKSTNGSLVKSFDRRKENEASHEFPDASQQQKGQAKTQELVTESNLASIHSQPENTALATWAMNFEVKSFWIGSIITKQVSELGRPIFMMHWTDGSLADFSYLHLPVPELVQDNLMSVGETKCAAIDYRTGHWALHPCNERRFFMCLSSKKLVDTPKTKATAKPLQSVSTSEPMPTGSTAIATEKTTSSNETKSSERFDTFTAEDLRNLLS